MKPISIFAGPWGQGGEQDGDGPYFDRTYVPRKKKEGIKGLIIHFFIYLIYSLFSHPLFNLLITFVISMIMNCKSMKLLYKLGT